LTLLSENGRVSYTCNGKHFHQIWSFKRPSLLNLWARAGQTEEEEEEEEEEEFIFRTKTKHKDE